MEGRPTAPFEEPGASTPQRVDALQEVELDGQLPEGYPVVLGPRDLMRERRADILTRIYGMSIVLLFLALFYELVANRDAEVVLGTLSTIALTAVLASLTTAATTDKTFAKQLLEKLPLQRRSKES